MAGSSQGAGSSPAGPVHKNDISCLDRRRLRLLDRKITRLDHSIRRNRLLNPMRAKRQLRDRATLDAKRRWLRRWMKGYEHP